jgi:hypothetical protein
LPDFEQLLRDARSTLPDPSDEATERARRTTVAAARGRGRGRRVAAALVLSTLIAAAAGFGVGRLLEPGGAALPVMRFGAAFVPADGWLTLQTGLATPARGAAALAANVPLRPEDLARKPGALPSTTVATLPPHGVVIVARLAPGAGSTQRPPARPRLRLDDAVPVVVAGRPARRIRSSVAAYELEVLVFFGAREPSAEAVADAQRELDRLVVGAPEVTITLRVHKNSPTDRFVTATLSGVASGAGQGDFVTLEKKHCGPTTEFGSWETAPTSSSGSWSLSIDTPIFQAESFRARWRGAVTDPVTIRFPASIIPWPKPRRVWSIEINTLPTGQSLAGKFIELERQTPRGWVLVGRARMKQIPPDRLHRGQWYYGARFTVRQRGLRLRAVLPEESAAPCFLRSVREWRS